MRMKLSPSKIKARNTKRESRFFETSSKNLKRTKFSYSKPE